MISRKYEIEIANSQNHVDLDQSLIDEVARRTLAEEQIDSATISLAFVDDTTIHELNRTYLNHDYATDVLSFLLECQGGNPPPPDGSISENASAAPPRGVGKQIDGEVIVSAETAARTAANFDWTPGDEVILYLIHGLLHLCGYDDQSESERALMRSREGEILALCNVVPGDAQPAKTSVGPQSADGTTGVES